MNLGNFPKADCGRFWILASTHVDQPKSTEKLNKAILLNLRLFWTFNYWTNSAGQASVIDKTSSIRENYISFLV